MMKLEGSCQCASVRFSVDSAHLYPFNVCYCSICRKTSGGNGAAINLSADFGSLEVEGKETVSVFSARVKDGNTGKWHLSQAQRSFCSQCGSSLWVWDPRWPDLVHPFASVIDTELPVPPERTHLMLASKPNWVTAPVAPGDRTFDEYPDESIAAWHERLGLVSD